MTFTGGNAGCPHSDHRGFNLFDQRRRGACPRASCLTIQNPFFSVIQLKGRDVSFPNRKSQTEKGVVIMSLKLNRLFVVLGFAGLAGCATAPTLTGRGTVAISSPGTRAIVAGPIDVRAYAGFRGGGNFLFNTGPGARGGWPGTPGAPPPPR